MSDSFGSNSDSTTSPGRRAAVITPNDAMDLAAVPKALWISAAGTLSIVAVGDDPAAPVPLGSLPIGTVVPIRVRRVRATGTTATVVAIY